MGRMRRGQAKVSVDYDQNIENSISLKAKRCLVSHEPSTLSFGVRRHNPYVDIDRLKICGYLKLCKVY